MRLAKRIYFRLSQSPAQKIFQDQVQAFKAQTAQMIEALPKDKLELYQLGYFIIQNLSPQEKKYIYFKLLKDTSLGHQTPLEE